MNARLPKCTAVVGGVLLACAWPLVGAAGRGTLAVDGVAIQGDVLEVGIVNTGTETLSGTVFARLVTEAGEVRAMVPVSLAGRQKVFVQLRAGSPILDVIQLGVIVDDGSPF
jgi:hypothetical protein